MLFRHEISFDPAVPEAALDELPAGPAVFCIRGESGEPYLNRTADLRRRVRKLLIPAQVQSRRLQLARLVRRIGWSDTASDFGAQMLLYRATAAVYGDRAAERMHLRPPFFLRMGMRNRFPRLWVTNAPAYAASPDLFGPFPSRNTAEHYAEDVLDLHLLRRCFQDLDPDPAFPGCIYSEIKKCLAPCYRGCSDERYSREAASVHAFLSTRGTSLLQALAAEREGASERLDFEAAAAAHTRLQKAEAVRRSAPELGGALAAQYGVVVQPSTHRDEVELYLLRSGTIVGPAPFSLLMLQLPNEASGSSSFFAHPAALRPVPLAGEADTAPSPGARLASVLASLETDRSTTAKESIGDHQALLARWYFRPHGKRQGELLLAEEGRLKVPALLRACARVYQAHVVQHAPGILEQAR